MNLFYLKKALLVLCLLFLFKPGRAQSDEYLQTMNWLGKNNLTLNNPTPLKGYQMYRDCDSNPVYKKVSGDTISFFTTTSWEAKTFEQVVQIQKRPYFNVTAFPLKVQMNGNFLVAKMTPVTFLFKKDTIFLLDFSESEEVARMKTLEQMAGRVSKNIQNAHGDVMQFAMNLANQDIDSSDIQNFEKIGNIWAADFPPNQVPLYYKDMFSASRSVLFTNRVHILSGKTDSTIAKVELMKEWDKEGKKYFFIDYQKNKDVTFFRLLNQYIISANGDFPVFENCRVNYNVEKRFVDSVNSIRKNEDADSLYQKYLNAADNPVKKFGKAVTTANETARVVLYGRIGSIDKLGRDVIPIVYNELSSFHDGLAFVARGFKGGYINKKGEEVIPLKYSRVSDFNNGLASVKINGQWQVINTKEQVLFSLPYEDVGWFNEGYALVYSNKKAGLINAKGKAVIPVKYDRIYDRFSEGFIRVSLNDKIGFIDSTGKALTPLIYDGADGFSEGLAGVRKDHKVGFIDNRSNVVIPFKYDLAFPFKQGVSVVGLNGLYGLVDKAGKEIIPVKYDGISPVDSGLFSVVSGGLAGLINKEGKTLLPFTYTRIAKFKKGYALVDKGDKRGLIDKIGKEIIPPRYNNLDPTFQDDLLLVQLNNRSGYVDKDGKEIIPVKYESATGFSEGLAAVSLDKKWGFINRKNEVVIPIRYDLVISFSNGLAAVWLNKKWGFVDAGGKLVVPCIFEQAEDFHSTQNK